MMILVTCIRRAALGSSWLVARARREWLSVCGLTRFRVPAVLCAASVFRFAMNNDDGVPPAVPFPNAFAGGGADGGGGDGDGEEDEGEVAQDVAVPATGF